MARHNEGYTLVELVVVMLIFSVVMTLISVSFNRIATSSGQLVKSNETDIGGLIGLELLRCDLELAGFGLPWDLSGVTYKETTKGEMVTGLSGTKAYSYNDEPPDAPKAYRTGDGAGYNNSDYLVLKGAALGMSATARSWSYLNYTSSGVIIKPSKSEVELIPGLDERVIVIKSSVRSGFERRELVTDGLNSNVFTLVYNTPLPNGFRPKSKADNYLVYGVASPEEDSSKSNSLLYPFNRADYYISRTSSISKTCADNTGILYKTTINHSNSESFYPIVDCVADFQVVFLMENSNDHTLVPESNISGFSLEDLRLYLKEVRVYIMVQQGKKDPGYSYPTTEPDRVIVVGDKKWNKADFLAKNWLNYHWKVYTIVVQPKNL